MELPSDPSQHERAELQSESTDKDHSVPPAYWVGPQHTTVDVLELSDGLGLFSSICNQRGLLTGEGVSPKRKVFATLLFVHSMEHHLVNKAYLALY